MAAAADPSPGYPLDPDARYVTVNEAFELRSIPGLSKMTVYRKIKDGTLPAWRIRGGKIRFDLADFDRLIVSAGPTAPHQRD